ncbi:hypothetical protein PIB30_111226, partial [Stylosanthes scabra]|nr:hypothetical protein [Stylosanthes scabra]
IQILHSIYFQSTDGHDLDQLEAPNPDLDADLEPPAASTNCSAVASHYTCSRCSARTLKGFGRCS